MTQLMSLPLAVTLLFSSPAQASKADNVTLLQAVSGADVMRVLEEAGCPTELKMDNEGDPLVVAWNTDLNQGFQVLFYDCSEDKSACATIQFRAWVKHQSTIALDEVNEWNRTSRLGRAYLDGDNDPTIEHQVRFAGGVTPEHFKDEFQWFNRALERFTEVFSGR